MGGTKKTNAKKTTTKASGVAMKVAAEHRRKKRGQALLMFALAVGCGGTPTAARRSAPEDPPAQTPSPDSPDRASEDPRSPTARSPESAELEEQRWVGIEEGTPVPPGPAHNSAVYRGRLFSYLRRGWTLPPGFDASLASQLTATCAVEFGANMEIVSFRFIESSGHETFDRSIAEQLARLQASVSPPPPPPSVASEYLGRRIAVRFRGRELR
jgi:hypothetical protein